MRVQFLNVIGWLRGWHEFLGGRDLMRDQYLEGFC